MMRQEEAFPSPLILFLNFFEFELASQFVMIRVHLLTLREPLVFTSRLEMCSMCERMEL